MDDLSPAAQAIFDAAWCDTGIILGDHEGTLRAQLAAALRAAAAHLGSCNASTELLALAAELGPTP